MQPLKAWALELDCLGSPALLSICPEVTLIKSLFYLCLLSFFICKTGITAMSSPFPSDVEDKMSCNT